MKLCKTCNTLVELALFPKRKDTPDGVGYKCNSCVRKEYNEKYGKNLPKRVITKTEAACTKCNVLKPLAAFSTTAKGKPNSWCRRCRIDASRNIAIKKIKEKHAALLKETTFYCMCCNIEKSIDEAVLKRKSIRSQICNSCLKINAKKLQQKSYDNLSKGYVRKLIKKEYKLSNVPDEFLETKRLILKLRRSIYNDSSCNCKPDQPSQQAS